MTLLSPDVQARILILAAEYVALVEAMQCGQHADEGEWQALSSERTTTHDELIRLTGITDRRAMYPHCRALLAEQRAALPVDPDA